MANRSGSSSIGILEKTANYTTCSRSSRKKLAKLVEILNALVFSSVQFIALHCIALQRSVNFERLLRLWGGGGEILSQKKCSVLVGLKVCWFFSSDQISCCQAPLLPQK